MRRNTQLSATASGPRSSGHGDGLRYSLVAAVGASRWMIAPNLSRLRRSLLGLLALTVGASLAHAAEESAGANRPADLPPFLFQPLYSGNTGSVYGVYEARHADLVLVRGGFDSGFQSGMVCQIDDGKAEVGEVMLVDVRNNCSAALILELAAGQVIEPGHSVRIKTVKF